MPKRGKLHPLGKVMNRGGEPADGTPLLLGVNLSRQLHLRRLIPGTTRVLTETSIAGRVDQLRVSKET